MTSEIIKLSASVFTVDGTSVSWGDKAAQRLCGCATFKNTKTCGHLEILAAHLGVEYAKPDTSAMTNDIDPEILRFQNAYVSTLREAANGKV